MLASVALQIGIVVAVIVLFVVLTIINLKTKKPEGCEEEKEACNTCTYRCIHNTNPNKNEKNN